MVFDVVVLIVFGILGEGFCCMVVLDICNVIFFGIVSLSWDFVCCVRVVVICEFCKMMDLLLEFIRCISCEGDMVVVDVGRLVINVVIFFIGVDEDWLEDEVWILFLVIFDFCMFVLVVSVSGFGEGSMGLWIVGI